MGRAKKSRWLSSALLAMAALLLPAAAQPQALLAKARAEKSADVTLELTELKRTSGNTVTMKAVINNKSARNFSVSWSNVYLLNTEGRMNRGFAPMGDIPLGF